MNKSLTYQHRQHGFTLIEVVIAISILSIILATSYSAITQIISTKKVLDDKRDNSLVASSIIRRLSKELQLATADNNLICLNLSGSSSSGTSTATMPFLGESSTGSSGGDSVTFIALEGGQYLPDGGTHTGIVQITYKMMKDPEKRDEMNLFSLIREEVPYVTPPQSNDPKIWNNAIQKSCNKRMVFPIAENIRRFKLQYYDLSADQWVNEWGQGRKDVPAMIYYTITAVSPLGNEETYSTIVPLGQR